MQYKDFQMNRDTGFLDCFTVCNFLNGPLSHLPMGIPFRMTTEFLSDTYNVTGVSWKRDTALYLWFGGQRLSEGEPSIITYFTLTPLFSQSRMWRVCGMRHAKGMVWKPQETVSIYKSINTMRPLDWLPPMWANTFRKLWTIQETEFLFLLGAFGGSGI